MSYGRGIEAKFTQTGVSLMDGIHAIALGGEKVDGEGDRDIIVIFHPMRICRRHVYTGTGGQPEDRGLPLPLVFELHIAMDAVSGEISLELFFGNDGTIRMIENTDRLGAANLQQEIDLMIHMVGRYGARRCDEDRCRALTHPWCQRLGVRLNLLETTIEQFAVDRILMRTLEHHPRATLFDAADCLLDRKAGARDQTRIDAHGNIARIVFDEIFGQSPGKLNQLRELEQRMIAESVPDRKWMPIEIAAEGREIDLQQRF